MTPEELNHKIEFITEALARWTARQEHNEERLEEERRSRLEFQEWSKSVTLRLTQLADLQSQRLDRQGQQLDRQEQRLDQQEKFYRDFLERTEALQRQALHLLNLLLDRIPPAASA